MKRTFIFLLFTLLCIGHAFAQSYPTLKANVVPPSPHAQGLLKTGHFPVSLYTGVPDILISLYEIQLKDFTLPITLCYNASGIKVDEEAGRAGLGWTLEAGGLVTHTVMGRYEDFCDWAYFNLPPDNELKDLKGYSRLDGYLLTGANNTLPFGLPQGMTHEMLYKALCSDNYQACSGTELAPDIYQYSLAGYAGKFIFSHDGTIIKEREDNVVITPVTTTNSTGLKELSAWVMTDPQGTKYYFGETEETVFADRPAAESYYSAFYLTRIETARGSVITQKMRIKATGAGQEEIPLHWKHNGIYRPDAAIFLRRPYYRARCGKPIETLTIEFRIDGEISDGAALSIQNPVKYILKKLLGLLRRRAL